MEITNTPSYKALKALMNQTGNTRNLYCLVAKSGAGKDTMADALYELLSFKKVKSVTTRPRRSPTEDVYYYISDEEYDKAQLVQRASFAGCRYGATLDEVNASQLFVICPEGMPELIKHCTRPIVALYLDTTDDTRSVRMKERGDSEESIQKRLSHDATSFGTIPEGIPVIMIDANRNKEDVLLSIIDAIASYETNTQ